MKTRLKHQLIIERLCSAIQSEPNLSLSHLAQSVQLSLSYTQKLFKSIVGVSPKEYANSVKKKRTQNALAQSARVTPVIFKVHNSSACFYDNAQQWLGMSASRYKSGASGQEIEFCIGECSLGSILIARSGKGICAISVADEPQQLIQELEQRFHSARIKVGAEEFQRHCAYVIDYIDNAKSEPFALALDIRGSVFEQKVWRELQNIEVGQQKSYSQIASNIGQPQATRAVARACAKNELAIIIPCHRVVKKSGQPGGYRWGVDRKVQILLKEQIKAKKS